MTIGELADLMPNHHIEPAADASPGVEVVGLALSTNYAEPSGLPFKKWSVAVHRRHGGEGDLTVRLDNRGQD